MNIWHAASLYRSYLTFGVVHQMLFGVVVRMNAFVWQQWRAYMLVYVALSSVSECFGCARDIIACKLKLKKKTDEPWSQVYLLCCTGYRVHYTKYRYAALEMFFLSVQHSVGRAVNYSIINIIVNNLFVASSLCRIYVTIVTKTTLLNIFEDDAQNIAASACDATAAPSHPSHGTAATTAYQCQCRTTDEYGHEYAATVTAPTECDASSASSAAATATPPALSSNHQ